MVPSSIIPRTLEALAKFAHDEPYLLAAIVIIASRNDTGDGMREVHNRSWGVMRVSMRPDTADVQGWIADIECLGAPPTVGLVESLLLLAENLPRDPLPDRATKELHAYRLGEELHGKENRQAWMLIGTAIRAAYGLGLDKVGNSNVLWLMSDGRQAV